MKKFNELTKDDRSELVEHLIKHGKLERFHLGRWAKVTVIYQTSIYRIPN